MGFNSGFKGLMTAMHLCEIWVVYSGEKAFCRHRVMKPIQSGR
jgi:hypothetical protein